MCKRCDEDIDVEKLFQEIEAATAKRALDMPTEEAALRVMFQAFKRLEELGWSEAIYCPKDETTFLSISAGSTGIHPTNYSGKWPDGSWWVHDGGDLWPARPILWKPITP